MRRSPFLLPALLAAALSVGAAGCGGGADDGRGRARAGVTAAPSVTGRADERPDPTRPLAEPATPIAEVARSNRRMRSMPLLEVDGALKVAAGADIVAVLAGDERGMRLWTGPADLAGPADLKLAHSAVPEGATIPSWAPVHVGGSGDGVQITYPVCTGARLLSCTAVRWTSSTGAEPIDGAGSGVVDVAADTTSLAVVRSPSRTATQQEFQESDLETELWVRRDDGQERRIAGPPPIAIALHGDTLAEVRLLPGDEGVCGATDLVLHRLDEPLADPRELGDVICGLGGARLVAADLDATSARGLIAANGEDGHGTVLRYDPAATGRPRRERLGADFEGGTFVSPTDLLVTGPVGNVECSGYFPDEAPRSACLLTRLTLRGAAG
ncbi:MAG: hypothetical protein PGN13_02865 [Patulibacter minatonensis]